MRLTLEEATKVSEGCDCYWEGAPPFVSGLFYLDALDNAFQFRQSSGLGSCESIAVGVVLRSSILSWCAMLSFARKEANLQK